MRTILLACLLGFLALGTTGCLTANGVANRVVTAPNLQRSYRGIDRIAGLWEKGLNGARDPFRAMDIPVGGATIRCAILEPAAYKTEISSALREAPGGKSTLEVKFRFHTVTNQAEPLACRGTVFLVHGYMGCKEMLYPWAFILAGQGFRVVAVDLRGHGKSTGETFLFGKQEAGDLRTLLDSLESSFPVTGPVAALGYSTGANICLQWMAADPRVQTVVAIAPFNEPRETFKRMTAALKLPILARTINAGLTRAAQRTSIDWSEINGAETLRRLTRPIFILGGENDSIVTPDDLAFLHSVAPERSELLVEPRANHDVISFLWSEFEKPVVDWLTKIPTSP